MRTKLNCWSYLAASSIGVAIPACQASDQIGPRTPVVAWSRSSARQAELVQAAIAGRRPLPPVPIVFIDGKRYETRDPGGPFAVINPELIASVRAFTGAEAEARAGTDGRNGVIWITTKESVARRR